MSTRGQIGFIQNGKRLGTYVHHDAFPEELGRLVVEFVAKRLKTVGGQEQFRSALAEVTWIEDEMAHVDADSVARYGWDGICSWYGVLRQFQGAVGLHAIADGNLRHLIDDSDFISAWDCEYAYVLDLDRGVLEFWEGNQNEPTFGNPLGESPDDFGLYPCAKVGEVAFQEATVDRLFQAYRISPVSV